MTSSAGCSGLMRAGSPPRRATPSRIAARSTTAGTPVKSCSRTRAGMNAISLVAPAAGSHSARARTSSAVTLPPSSRRRRFSSRTFSEYGSRATRGKPARSRASRLWYETVASPAVSVESVPNVLLMSVFLPDGPWVFRGVRRAMGAIDARRVTSHFRPTPRWRATRPAGAKCSGSTLPENQESDWAWGIVGYRPHRPPRGRCRR